MVSSTFLFSEISSFSSGFSAEMEVAGEGGIGEEFGSACSISVDSLTLSVASSAMVDDASLVRVRFILRGRPLR